jgi:hypothetical protein
VPRVVQLGGQPDVLARHARRADALADLLLVAVGKGRVDVPVAGPQSGLNGPADLTGLGLPCPEANSRDLGARVELEGLAEGLSVRVRWGKLGGCLRGGLSGGHDYVWAVS